MKIGDKVKFKELDKDGYIHHTDYFTKEIGEHVMHGDTNPCDNPKPVIVATINNLFVVKFTDQNNEIVQLGFKESFLEVIEPKNLVGRYIKSLAPNATGVSTFNEGVYAKLVKYHGYGYSYEIVGEKINYNIDNTSIGVKAELMPEGFKPEYMDINNNNKQKEYKEGDICVWEGKTCNIENGEIFMFGGRCISHYATPFISKIYPRGDAYSEDRSSEFRKATQIEIDYYNRFGIGANIGIMNQYKAERLQPIESIYDVLINKQSSMTKTGIKIHEHFEKALNNLVIQEPLIISNKKRKRNKLVILN